MISRNLPKAKDFCRRLVLMKIEASKLGLFRTMQAIDTATTTVGWEIQSEVSLERAIKKSNRGRK